MEKYDCKNPIIVYKYKNHKFLKSTLESSYNALKRKYEILIYEANNEYRVNVTNIETNQCITMLFKYNDEFFNDCYKFDGIYETNKYKGSRKIVNEILNEIEIHETTVDKREEYYCKSCGEKIGYIFNDNKTRNASNFLAPFIENEIGNELCYEPNVFICDECGKVFCENCIALCDDHFSMCLCGDCLDDSDDGVDEIEFIQKWSSTASDCEKSCDCEYCENYDDCYEEAVDASSGYAMFCDSIVGCGYDSMDDFWECNGI